MAVSWRQLRAAFGSPNIAYTGDWTMMLWGRPVQIGDPERTDVVIFDAINAHDIRKALNPQHRVEVFPVNPETLWIGIRVVGAFARLLQKIRVKEALLHPNGLVRGLLKELRGSYLQACLEAMKPKAVVTYIDNSGEFSWLSKRCRSFPMIAVQNGTRLKFAAPRERGYHVQHLFSLGRREIEEFPAMEYVVEHFYPVGSLRASLNWHQAMVGDYDLVIVSTWRGNIGFTQDVVDTMRSMRVMDELLASYIRERSVRAAILLRAARGGEHWHMREIGMDEETYFRSIYGDSATIIEADFVTRNVYPVMGSGRVVVSCLSTAALEAFGWGKKILYCNFTDTDLYHAGLDPAIVTTDASRDGFFERLDGLLSTPDEEYDQRYQDLRAYYIANPPDRPTHVAIAEGIDAIISSETSRAP